MTRSHISNDASSSAPSNTTPDVGFDVTTIKLRSLLIHPIGILLASLLNGIAISQEMLKEFSSNLGMTMDELSNLLTYQSDSSQTSPGLCDNILAFAVSKWKKEAEEVEAGDSEVKEGASGDSEVKEGAFGKEGAGCKGEAKKGAACKNVAKKGAVGSSKAKKGAAGNSKVKEGAARNSKAKEGATGKSEAKEGVPASSEVKEGAAGNSKAKEGATGNSEYKEGEANKGAASNTEVKEGEKELTEKIMNEFQSRIDENKGNDENLLMILAEKNIKSTSTIVKLRGRMDFVVVTKNVDADEKKSVVMIIEFGMEHKIWWQKMSQILTYVNILCEAADKDNDITFDQPILLTVVTVNKDPKKKNAFSTINEDEGSVGDDNAQDFQETDIQSNVTTDTQKKEKLGVRYGVFLCTPKVDGERGDKFRIALLWRKDALDVKDASMQFGKILYAAQTCASLRGKFAAKFMEPIDGKKVLYQYLGPNCCRIGESVSLHIGLSFEITLHFPVTQLKFFFMRSSYNAQHNSDVQMG